MMGTFYDGRGEAPSPGRRGVAYNYPGEGGARKATSGIIEGVDRAVNARLESKSTSRVRTDPEQLDDTDASSEHEARERAAWSLSC